jgi:hypothetical protein
MRSNRLGASLLLYAAAVGFTAIAITGCDSAGDSQGGRIVVHLTDMPFPFDDAAEANVTVVRIELVGGDSTDSIVLSDDIQPFNLLELQNDVTVQVADVQVPDGDWSQLRFIVADSASVVMKDATVYGLKVPSGSQTGIKVNLPDIDLSDIDDLVEVTVDFDVEHSFVVLGNPSTPAGINGFLFKPVLRLDAIEINGVPVDSINTMFVAAPGMGTDLQRLD